MRVSEVWTFVEFELLHFYLGQSDTLSDNSKTSNLSLLVSVSKFGLLEKVMCLTSEETEQRLKLIGHFINVLTKKRIETIKGPK